MTLTPPDYDLGVAFWTPRKKSMKGLLGEKQSPDNGNDADDAPADGNSSSSSSRTMVWESRFSLCRAVTHPHQAPDMLSRVSSGL